MDADNSLDSEPKPNGVTSQWACMKNLWAKFHKGKDADEDYEAHLTAQMPAEMQSRKPIMTTTLILVSLLMAVIVLVKTGSLNPDAEVFVQFGADYPLWTFKGQVWRLFTNSFLHFGFTHLLFNMICLWSIGGFLEKLVGHGKLFCIYFLTALTGSLMSCAFHYENVSAGASGAVFGLFGAGVVYVFLRASELKFNSKDLFGYMRNGLAFLGINFVYSMFPGIDLAGHIGGFIGGVVVGAVLAIPHHWKNLPNIEWYHRGIAMVTGILCVILLISWFAASDASRLGVKELSVEIGKFMREKTIEILKENGAKNVDVVIKDLTLFHDGGNNYHGMVSFVCKYDGETEELNRTLKVTYDGEQFMYEMGK